MTAAAERRIVRLDEASIVNNEREEGMSVVIG
jgi:hypothetical protein